MSGTMERRAASLQDRLLDNLDNPVQDDMLVKDDSGDTDSTNEDFLCVRFEELSDELYNPRVINSPAVWICHKFDLKALPRGIVVKSWATLEWKSNLVNTTSMGLYPVVRMQTTLDCHVFCLLASTSICNHFVGPHIFARQFYNGFPTTLVDPA